jgi:triacylglycerol lipase
MGRRGGEGEKVRLNYPVLLIHGAAFRDKMLGIEYWGRIPRHLAEHGVEVYYGGTDAWGSIEGNAGILKERIGEILRESGAERVNLIAHSRGGLEARYLVSSLAMDSAVASLTTITTPHRGVKAMNIALKLPEGLYRFGAFFVNLWCRIMGDQAPDFYVSSRQLAELACAEFNKNNPDSERVYYQSYAARMKYPWSDLAYLITMPFIQGTDGDNDGLCPVESAQWGNFRGVIAAEGIFGVSHSGIIDRHPVRYRGVDILELYLAIVKELSDRGF